jgi:hypothetical protein
MLREVVFTQKRGRSMVLVREQLRKKPEKRP